MLKTILEAKGVKYERKSGRINLTFKYNSSVFLVMRKLLTEECSITLSDKELFGMKDEFHQIVLSKEKFAKLQLNETRICTILENQEIYDKILFEETIKQSEKQKEEQKYYKEKAIRVFATKRELAQMFIKIQPLYYDRSKIWWIWNHEEIRWDITDETDILNLIDEHATVNTIQSKERVEILEALRQEGRLNRPKEIENTWVQFKDKIIDVKTGGTFEASPRYFAVNPIPWKIGETEDTPTIDRLFSEWVGEEKAVTLKEICAYCFLPDYPLHHIFFFWGSGCNGKSKFLKFIKNLIGVSNCTSVNFETLTKSQFGTFSLYKKLACQIGETEFGSKGQTTMLKNLSGDDMIRFEAKGKDGFDGYNYAKLLIATNHLPDVKDKSDGWYRRTIDIKFPNQFEEGRCPLLDISDEEYENFCNQCARRLRELLKRGVFTNVGTIEERRESYDKASNPFEAFIEENYEVTGNEENDKIPLDHFRKQYYNYLVTRGFNTIHASNVQVNKKMSELGLRRGRPWFEGLPYLNEGEKLKKYAWMGLQEKPSGKNKSVASKNEPVINSESLVYKKAHYIASLKTAREKMSQVKRMKKEDFEILFGNDVLTFLLTTGEIFEPVVGYLEITK